MKLILAGEENPNIHNINSLSDLSALNTITENNKFDVVVTNPPFGTSGKITNKQTLAAFELGYKWNKSIEGCYKSNKILKSQVTEVLFIERCLDLLKEGGRLGIVLPNGHFENGSLAYLREFIKRKANILGIVKLPAETFIPYGTGVKTSLLFLTKRTTSNDNSKIFFSEITKLGYSGNKNGSPKYLVNKFGNIEKDEQGNKILDEDFSKVLKDYNDFSNENLEENAQSFSIMNKELNNRFDYNYYAPKYKKLSEKLEKLGAVPLSQVCKILKTKSKILKNKALEVNYVELSDINTCITLIDF